MTRKARQVSATGIYHIMMRGINKQDVFESKNDYERFKNCLADAKKKSGLKLFGYFLMSNHIHIVAGIGTEDLGVSIKRIGVSYAV